MRGGFGGVGALDAWGLGTLWTLWTLGTGALGCEGRLDTRGAWMGGTPGARAYWMTNPQ
jgi:hypothetical protein